MCAAGGGRWPQVINIWDIGAQGWKGWASNVDRMNLKRRKAFYGDWWDEAARVAQRRVRPAVRRGTRQPDDGGDRGAGCEGHAVRHEVLHVRPGAQLEFLAAVAETRVPLLRDYGHEATGLYEVLSNQHEVVMVWATDIPSQVRLRENRDTARGLCDTGEPDERLVEWDRRSAEWVTGGDTHIMTPLPRTVYGPPDWEDASLDEWLDQVEDAQGSRPTKKAAPKKASAKKAAKKGPATT